MTTDERIPALLAGLRSLVGSSTEHPTAEEARRLADKLQDVAAKLKAQAAVAASVGSLSQQPQQQAPAVAQLAHKSADTCGSHKVPADEGELPAQPASKRQKKASRPFDMTKYRQRYVALEVMYLGWRYSGLARQETTDMTIEAQLFSALRQTRLIPEDAQPAALRYSRCGRTDKGVSACGQVVALMLRSNALAKPASEHQVQQNGVGTGQAAEAPQISSMDESAEQPLPGLDQEIDYPSVLNKVLPDDIRVLGWVPVEHDFNARFSCRWREYKYYVTDSEEAPLDIGAMQQAADLLVGQHDFRNFCKLDVLAVRTFERRIMSFNIQPVCPAGTSHIGNSGQQQPSTAGTGPGSLQALAPLSHGTSGLPRVYCLTVRGTAFLWHQVRCMVAVLLMVGQHLEPPSIVSELLDVAKHPCKPTYMMAPEEPLILYACHYEGLTFHRPPRSLEANLGDMGRMVAKHLVAASLTGAVRDRVAADAAHHQQQQQQQQQPSSSAAGSSQAGAEGATTFSEGVSLSRGQRSKGGSSGGGGGSAGVHVPLLRRPREASVEERLAKYGRSLTVAGGGAGGGGEEGGDDDG